MQFHPDTLFKGKVLIKLDDVTHLGSDIDQLVVDLIDRAHLELREFQEVIEHVFVVLRSQQEAFRQLRSHGLPRHDLVMDDCADAAYTKISAADVMGNVLEEIVLEMMQILPCIAGGFGFTGTGVEPQDVFFVEIKDQQHEGNDDPIDDNPGQQPDTGTEGYRLNEGMPELDLQQGQQQ